MEEILELLRENARLSVEDISAMTKKTVDEVKAIIKEMEANGTILKYVTVVNPEKIQKDKKVCAEIELQVTPERERGFDAVVDRIYRFPQVRSLYLMSGANYDLKVVIEGDTFQSICDFVARKLATLEGVRETATHFIMRTYKENDSVYIEEDKDHREGAMA